MQRQIKALGNSATVIQLLRFAQVTTYAGCGSGIDSPKDPTELARLRAVSLTHLRLLFGMAREERGSPAAYYLPRLREDADMAGVREEQHLRKLPPEEQEAFRAFWKELDAWVEEGE